MRKREFGVSFGSGGVAVACRLPWVGVADGDFPRGAPRRIPPAGSVSSFLWWERGAPSSLI